MAPGDLVQLAREALLLAVLLSLPVAGAAALVSLLVSTLQAATQIADSTLAHLPRLLVVTAVLVASGRWMGALVISFAARAFTLAP